MRLNIAICDDNPLALMEVADMTKTILSERNIECVYNLFDDPRELYASDIKYDIALLDIKMSEIDGISLAKKLLSINEKCIVFFITNYMVYLDAAFDVGAFRCLPKPLDYERLQNGIKKALIKIIDTNTTIQLTDMKTKVPIKIELLSIIFVENSNRHARIVTTDQVFIAKENFRTVVSLIEKKTIGFSITHKSIYINMRYVNNFDHHSVCLVNGDKEYHVDISRRKYIDFKKRFINWISETQ